MGRRIANPDRRKHRSSPSVTWVFGVVLLLASLTGTQWFLAQPRSIESLKSDSPTDAPAIVCIGHVDGEFGISTLSPAIPGRVIELIASEGADLAEGDTILRLDDRHAKGRVEEALAAERLAEEVVVQSQQHERIHGFKLAQQSAVVSAAQAKLAAAQFLLEHRKEIHALKSLTQAELDAATEQVKEAEQLVRIESSRLEECNQTDPKAKHRLAVLERDAVRIKRQQAETALADCVLRAPRSGRVVRMQVGIGDTCNPAVPAVLFLPACRLIVRAEIEQEFLSRVHTGMRATITDDSSAGSHEWRGELVRLGDWIARRRSIVFEPGVLNDVRTLECIVQLSPSTVPLRVGQRVRVRLEPDHAP